MNQLNEIANLEALLTVLRKHGVSEYANADTGLTIRFESLMALQMATNNANENAIVSAPIPIKGIVEHQIVRIEDALGVDHE